MPMEFEILSETREIWLVNFKCSSRTTPRKVTSFFRVKKNCPNKYYNFETEVQTDVLKLYYKRFFQC